MQRRGFRFDEVKAARASRFSTELSDALHELHITHKSLAQELGVSQHSVDSWTRSGDPNIPATENLEKLCALLELRRAGLGKRLAHVAGHAWEPSKPPTLLAPVDEQVKTNLPHALTTFVGRSDDLAELRLLLKDHRLVTLAGTGGIGKTRLSIELARDVAPGYPAGVWLVELAAINDPSLLPQVVARVLSIREQVSAVTIDTLVDHLRHKHLLLVLDNCEHLIDECAFLAVGLLKQCPNLSIVATSREPMNVQGEMLWQVQSLSMPAPNTDKSHANLADYESVRLFMDRARASQPRFKLDANNASMVADICLRLDGIPLSIELASACLRFLTLQQITSKLTDRFRLLEEGDRTELPRHKTLRAAVDWSYELLSPTERDLFRKLCIFTGGWYLEAAEAVCQDESLAVQDVFGALRRLVDKSLVVVDMGGREARYHMLETMRQYSRERLAEAAKEDAVAEKHAFHCLWLLQQLETELPGPNRRDWLNRIEIEHDNIRAALRWAIDHKRAELAITMSGIARLYWNSAGLISEGRRWLEEALSVDAGEVSSVVRAKALNSLGILAYNQGDHANAARYYEEALALARAEGNRRGVSAALTNLGHIATREENYEKARRYLQESLALKRERGDPRDIAIALHNLAEIPIHTGDYGEARTLEKQALALFQEMGEPFLIANALDSMGLISLGQGDYGEAINWLEQSYKMYDEANLKRGIPYVLKHLGMALLRNGDLERAGTTFRSALSLSRDVEDMPSMVEALAGLAAVHALQGESSHGSQLAGLAQALLAVTHARIDPLARLQYRLNLELAPPAPGEWPSEREPLIEQALVLAVGHDEKQM